MIKRNGLVLAVLLGTLLISGRIRLLLTTLMKRYKISIFKNYLPAALLIVTLILSAGLARAALSIDYNVGGSGSIFYDPTQNNFLNGVNLTVNSVTSTDTPSNAGNTLIITGGLLNFQTGAFTGQSGNVWNFGSPGILTVQGGISGINVPANTTLYSGSFLSASVTELSAGAYLFDIVGATLGGTNNPSIYQYYGIPSSYMASSAMNLSFIGMANAGGGFTSLNDFGGVIVDSPISTPIPAASQLFGSGLVGLVIIRKKMQK